MESIKSVWKQRKELKMEQRALKTSQQEGRRAGGISQRDRFCTTLYPETVEAEERVKWIVCVCVYVCVCVCV